MVAWSRGGATANESAREIQGSAISQADDTEDFECW